MIPITRPRWIATVFLILGVVLIVVGAWFGAEAALFAVDGATTTGTVVAKRIDPNHFSSTNSTSRRDPNGYLVTVVFTPQGGADVRSELLVDHDAWDQLTLGQTVAVEYVRALPGVMNTLADQSGGWSLGPLAVGLLALLTGAGFATFGARFLITSRRGAALVRRLMAVGVRTTGSDVDNDAAELWIRYNLQRRLRYRYADAAGHEHTGLSGWMPRAEALRWHPEAAGVVRYDPDQPDVSAWFGHEHPATLDRTAARPPATSRK